MGESRLVQAFQRRAQILKKKIDASREETGIFVDELAEIEDQLQVSLLLPLSLISFCSGTVGKRKHVERAGRKARGADRNAQEQEGHAVQAGEGPLQKAGDLPARGAEERGPAFNQSD
jgi:uncharacterized sporulation protein YeaH/YhbH (DUF444 family)